MNWHLGSFFLVNNFPSENVPAPPSPNKTLLSGLKIPFSQSSFAQNSDLSICFGIISQYGGRIWLDEEQTPGATFIVELPLVQGEPTSFPEAETGVAKGGITGKRILLVEDEDEIAMMLERILLQDGHQVVIARNGDEALECLAQDREQGERFDLIISDIKMPGLSGPELYERLREDKKELDRPLIFMTGDTMSRSTERFLNKVKLPYLTKPFAINAFRKLLTEVLG